MMVSKYVLTFHKVQEPLTELVTKLGGQPTWLDKPQWPLSRTTGKPMQFLCQIVLDPRLFGEIPGRMAYVFMTPAGDIWDPEVGEVDREPTDAETWNPEAGENAVIIQPGICDIATEPLLTGPTLGTSVISPLRKGRGRYDSVPFECAVDLLPGEDPIGEDFYDEGLFFLPYPHKDDYEDENTYKEAQDAYRVSLNESKIGGTPVFVQDPEYPANGKWRLLLQLNYAIRQKHDGQEDFLFGLNFGDVGVGYAFLSEDGMRGKFLWQCC